MTTIRDTINIYGSTAVTDPEPTTSAQDAERSPSNHDGNYTENLSPSIFEQFWDQLFTKWINLPVLLAPAGIAANYTGVNPNIVFVVNALAMIRLAGLLGFGTESVAHHCGDAVGALLNASFGNAVELIVAIIALKKREIVIVQTSLIGSILSNILLVLRASFIAGGFNREKQQFNITMANTSSALLLFAAVGLMMIAVFRWSLPSTDDGTSTLHISRGTAIIMVLIYASYTYLQLKSHKHLYDVPSGKTAVRGFRTAPQLAVEDIETASGENVGQGSLNSSTSITQLEVDEPELSLWAAIILRLLSTAIIAWSAECVVASLDYFVDKASISRVFVGLIPLPIVGNAAEHATAVSCAWKDKMDIAMGVAAGSSTQVAMFLIPFVVILGWCLGIDEMTLAFDLQQLVAVMSSVLLANIVLVVWPHSC